MVKNVDSLLSQVRSCELCDGLPLGPRPILQVGASAKILIAGQAPGCITHHKGIPFDNPSGNRLRDWLGISREEFYDPSTIALVPMGFCFPGTGKGGDLPPRKECADTWRIPVLEQLQQIELTLVIGQYAIDWHIADDQKMTLTDRVANWKNYMPDMLPLPHPSPRNNRWLKRNPWFEEDVLPALKTRVGELI
ncbi:MAG: uracil-DNA glycosylase family protein [Rhizobiaceae bacterium]|nr:uracil-DNA glycosylase family protein [Rhizobiaceae bacterium]